MTSPSILEVCFMKPRLAMVLGDPAGIGPEITAKLLSDPSARAAAEIFLVVDKTLFEEAMAIAQVHVPYVEAPSFEEADLSQGVPVLQAYRGASDGAFARGRATAENGRYALDTLKICLEPVVAGKLDALCFAPLNKNALHLGGMEQNDELHWFADQIAYRGPVCEFNVLEELWTSRVTSHVALKDVSSLLTPENVAQAVELIDGALRRAGKTAPRIAVCGLNPHNGENGLFGREEIDVIAPGIALAAKRGAVAEGPFPPDTIFLKGRDGVYDAIVTMYHDQGQIAMKLMGFDRGVTVQGGLPIPITTPAHGTAFDIVGMGKADVGAMRNAFRLACRMGLNRRQLSAPATRTAVG
jgi:4-hydroxythreonine-4-phosphate dehydrogenase